MVMEKKSQIHVMIAMVKEINNLQKKFPQIIPICTSFEDLNLEQNSIDHMFCRWSLAWVQNHPG